MVSPNSSGSYTTVLTAFWGCGLEPAVLNLPTFPLGQRRPREDSSFAPLPLGGGLQLLPTSTEPFGRRGRGASAVALSVRFPCQWEYQANVPASTHKEDLWRNSTAYHISDLAENLLDCSAV